MLHVYLPLVNSYRNYLPAAFDLPRNTSGVARVRTSVARLNSKSDISNLFTIKKIYIVDKVFFQYNYSLLTIRTKASFIASPRETFVVSGDNKIVIVLIVSKLIYDMPWLT